MPTEFKPKRRADRDAVTYAEFSGLRNDIAPERFDATDLAVANNVTLDKSRRIARRAGATRRVNMPAHSLWAAGDQALYVSADALYRLSAALVPTLLRNGMSGAPVSYARAGDSVYFNDGVVSGVIEAGAARSWGMAVPQVAANVAVGDLTPGTYGFTATYLRADGQESGAPGAAFGTLAAGQSFTITVPASIDPDVVGKRIYLTTPDEEALYCAATLDNTGAAYTPSAADIAAMNEPLITQFMGPAPAGQLVAYYKGRMFVAVGDVLYPSEPFAYELFDLRNYIQLDGPITLLAPMEDQSGEGSGFFIGTTKSCGVLAGSDPAEFKYTPKTEYGAVQGALAFVDGSLFLEGELGARSLPLWLTTEGICAGMPSLEVSNLTRSRYGFATGAAGAAYFDPDASMFVAVTGAAGGTAIALQTENQTLTSFSNYGYNSFARVGGKNLAASAAGLFELVGEDDNGLPIPGTVTLGTTDFGSTFVKTVDRLYVGYRSKADITLRVTTDDEHDNSYTLPVSDQTELATQRVKVGKGLAGRYWQFTLQNLDGADFAFDTIDVKTAKLARRINGRA